MRRAVLSILVLAACRRDGPAVADAAVTADPAATAAPIASASSSASPSSNAAEAPPAPRTTTTAIEDLVAPESADLETPLAKIGKVSVWGVEDGDATKLVAKASDGKAKLLRRTSGKVKAIDAVAIGDDIVVAWASELARGGTQVVAVVTAASDLSKVTPPTTVAMVAAPIQMEGHVAIAKNPKGGVIVVHQGPEVPCKLLGQATECVSFEVKSVTAGGVVTKLATQKLHGGPSPEYRLLDVDGRALAILASSMRGGRTLEGVVVTYDPNDPKPAFSVPICGGAASHFPELLRGTDGEIVSVCPDGKKLRVAAVTVDGKDLAPATKGETAAVQKVECGALGRPKLVLEGGSAIELVSYPDVVQQLGPKCRK